MRVVYVVVQFHCYEGWDKPAGAFASREIAQAYIKMQNPRDEFDIVELEVRG